MPTPSPIAILQKLQLFLAEIHYSVGLFQKVHFWGCPGDVAAASKKDGKPGTCSGRHPLERQDHLPGRPSELSRSRSQPKDNPEEEKGHKLPRPRSRPAFVHPSPPGTSLACCEEKKKKHNNMVPEMALCLLASVERVSEEVGCGQWMWRAVGFTWHRNLVVHSLGASL
ncbi:hypothetical protein B0T17DRAFT_536632 [Bombardia bombarda]|uniref:Uncharacterized protein n=1 Tax=Bombardia bombarda TaxID=252184 RepID=A0AA39WM89_9PEZI|nr:hypothetical protein B0T17DRAFT_536632 [Bombardia bombarda]